MATKKKMLQAAAGQAGGAGGAALDITDVFSTYLYEGTGSGQTIQNGINLGQQAKSGEFTDRNAAYPVHLNSTISLSGDFTVETWVYNDTPNASGRAVFASDFNGGSTNYQFAINSSGYIQTYSNNTFVTATSQPLSTQQWYHIAASRSGSTIYLWVDGQAAGSGTDSNTFLFQNIGALGGYTSDASWVGNISNFRVSNTARYTSSFTPPTEPLSSDASTILLALQDPPFVDQTNTYSVSTDSTVSASTLSPFGETAEAGEGGLVWIKDRDNSGYIHNIYDTERGLSGGFGLRLQTNATSAEATTTGTISSFNGNGFSLGDNAFVNNSGSSIASWTFRKAPKFFDVVEFTPTSQSGTLSHSLNTSVGSIIFKRTDDSSDWFTYHKDVTGFLRLNTTDSVIAYNIITGTTDTTFDYNGFTVGGTYVAYVFAHNDGDGTFGPGGDQDVIKCGSYTGTGAAGNFIDLGFEPQWVLYKRTDASNSWVLQDNMRGMSHSGYDLLFPDLSGAEVSGTAAAGAQADPNGFIIDLTGGDHNATGGNYIYIAIRRGPLAPPESATEVFDVTFGDSTWGTGEYSTQHTTSNITVDMFMGQSVNGGPNYVQNRLVDAAQYMATSSTSAESTSAGWSLTNGQTGLFHDTSRTDPTRIFKLFRRAPSFFDVVAYSGNNTQGRSVSHNLGVAPEMIWVKGRDVARGWNVYHKDLTPSGGQAPFMELNATDAVNHDNSRYPSAPTATDFILGSNEEVNSGNYNYIAYLFASLDGISKVGSFSHTNGTPTNVDCGFSSGARFVLWKSTNYANDWVVFDTVRGIVAGNDPYLSLNNTNAEVTSYDIIDPTSSGFQMTGVMATGDYIFYAIA